ncbi:amidohydrolase [Sphingomonas sanguinis]|uniref:amidohydrolase family protein n=1 Tax=Sphingomonas sp. LC-1 TaxID=3110957 RepID=UPI0021BA77B1|nr:amidohydrolase [Sphingomonas sp. LC-1]MCT8003162.1 amidohydrolase [Sphingomonas sp. LC-1]
MTARDPVIDLHSHWLAPAVVEHLARRSDPPRIARRGEGRALIETAIGALSLDPQWFDIAYRLAHLDRHNVVHQLLSWPTTLNLEPVIGLDEALPLWRSINDGFGAIVAAHPARFSGLAVLSTADLDWSITELRRAHESLGLIGFVLPINAFGSTAGVHHLAPLLREANRLGSHVYLHTGYAAATVPGQPTPVDRPEAPGLAWTLAGLHHFASAFATVALSDALDDYPDLTVQIAMLAGAGAGALLYEQALIAPARFGSVNPARLDRLWLDTGAIGQGPIAIRATLGLLGTDRVVFGSDYAPADDIGAVLARVEQATPDIASRRAVRFDNARTLLARHGRTIPETVHTAIEGTPHVRI